MHCRVRYHLNVRQIAPITTIFVCQHNKLVKPSYNTFILPCAPFVYPSQQSLTSVLQTEELTEMQLKHLLAAVLYIGDKRRFRRIERHHDVCLLPFQQLRQLTFMFLSFAQISYYLSPCSPVVVVRIIYVQICHPHIIRKRIERRPLMLVCCNNGNVPSANLREIRYLVQQHTLHSAGVVC